MKTKQLSILTLFFTFVPLNISAIDPFSVIAGPIASTVVKNCGERAWEYMYSAEKDKRIIRKHLPYNTYRPSIPQGCSENFTENCAIVAQHLEKMEQYHEKHNAMMCLEYQIALLQKKGVDTTKLEQKSDALKAEYPENNNVHVSYFESLSPEEQEKLLTLERNIVMEHTPSAYYQEELENIHNALSN